MIEPTVDPSYFNILKDDSIEGKKPFENNFLWNKKDEEMCRSWVRRGGLPMCWMILGLDTQIWIIWSLYFQKKTCGLMLAGEFQAKKIRKSYV